MKNLKKTFRIIAKSYRGKYQIFVIKEYEKGDIIFSFAHKNPSAFLSTMNKDNVLKIIKIYDNHFSLHKDGNLTYKPSKFINNKFKAELIKKVQNPKTFKGLESVTGLGFNANKIESIFKKYNNKKANDLFEIDLEKYKQLNDFVNISIWLFDKKNKENFELKFDIFKNKEFHIFNLTNTMVGICTFSSK
jgi:hypothetical protein